MASKKTATKTAPAMLVSPTKSLKQNPATCTVQENEHGTAYIVTLKFLVGSPKENNYNGKTWLTSGTLLLDKSISIGGNEYYISTSGFGKNSKIVVKPKAAAEVTAGEDEDDDDMV